MTEKDQTEQNRLASLRLRDTNLTVNQTASYSRNINRLRWVLPVLALLFVLVLFIWPYWHAHNISIAMIESVPNLMIENLKMTGLDVKDQQYSVTAKRALRTRKSFWRNNTAKWQ